VKIEVKKLDNEKRELNIEVSGDIVSKKFDDVYKEIGKEAKVPGFRPGNAPLDMLQKHYSSLAHEQVIKDLVPELYNQAIEKENLDVIELPQISEVSLLADRISFKARVQLAPEIKLKNYRKIRLNYKRIEVGQDEISRSLDSLKESHKVPSLDDIFAKGMGYPDLNELKAALERQIYLQKENAQRQELESRIIEAITKEVEFNIPQSMVSRQLDDLVKQAKLDMALRGMPRQQIDGQEAEMKKHFQPQAQEQVKVYLVLAEVAKKESIAIDEHMPRRVMEFLLKEAEWTQEK